jgi:class 3 adenylate cyclase
MGKQNNHPSLKLSSQRHNIQELMLSLETITGQAKTGQEDIEKTLYQTFEPAPENIIPNSSEYYAVLNCHLYRYILKHYKHKEDGICFWRYIKNLSEDQLNYNSESNPELQMMDSLIRIYFYSDPLDDLTCMFVPISNKTLIDKYLDWIKSYFYNVNYPTSLLWLYALDSSLASLFPDEITYLGKSIHNKADDIMVPDFDYKDTLLLKRFSDEPGHFAEMKGESANSEFRQIFTFLQHEYKDRCLSRSGKQEGDEEEWRKYKDVLKFGVADVTENGCISFSDMRASTEFLNTYTKDVYLNEIQQPFFEETKLINEKYGGRIDKFMGDNVMCVFLNNHMNGETSEEKEKEAILNNFFALFALCKILSKLISEEDVTESERKGFAKSKLGLRSGVTYGEQISRVNLGNDVLRDFTVTGGTVNLAARLEHFSIQELIIHNDAYFERVRERFPQISSLISIGENSQDLNPETDTIIKSFTLYQNILSNLDRLEKAKFDIRFNNRFYVKLRKYLEESGYKLQNPETSELYGYEEYDLEGFKFKFYFSYYNPKGFAEYKRVWILPLEPETLNNLDIDRFLKPVRAE